MEFHIDTWTLIATKGFKNQIERTYEPLDLHYSAGSFQSFFYVRFYSVILAYALLGRITGLVFLFLISQINLAS